MRFISYDASRRPPGTHRPLFHRPFIHQMGNSCSCFYGRRDVVHLSDPTSRKQTPFVSLRLPVSFAEREASWFPIVQAEETEEQV